MTSDSPLTGLRILVTGASGFLGRHICRRLCENRAEVHAVSRTVQADDSPHFRWTRGDVADRETVDALFRNIRPDIVFQLTGHGVGAPGIEHVLPTFRNDLMTTVNVLVAATQHSVRRVILAASLEEPIFGSDEMVPSSPYAAAKSSGSMYAQMFHKLYGTPVVIVRPFMTYGPGQREHKLIPQVTLALLQGQVPKLTSGQRPVDWIYIDDVIDGMFAASHVPGVEGCAIDLGSGTLVTIYDVVMQLVQIVGAAIEPEFGALPDRPLEKVRVADIVCAREKLGWMPKTSLRSGLEQTVEWYRKELAHSAVRLERAERE